MHLENPPVPVGPRIYYFTILLILREIGSLHLANPPVPVGPRLLTTLLNLREIQRKFLLLSLLLVGFPPRPQQFASRKPTCAGWTQNLYYFAILLILREIGSLHLENPPVPVGPRFYYFTDVTRNPEKIPPSLFTFNRISSTASAVYISKTHLCRLDPEFTILLFYYFAILLFFYFTILLFYNFTILLFYFFTILLFYYFTILLFYYFTILLFYYFTILLFYYFTILLFYYFTILLFYYLLFYYFTLFYFTILVFYYLVFYGLQESLHLENLPLHVGPPICMLDRGIP